MVCSRALHPISRWHLTCFESVGSTLGGLFGCISAFEDSLAGMAEPYLFVYPFANSLNFIALERILTTPLPL